MFRTKYYSFWMFISFIIIQIAASMINLGVTPILPFIQNDLHLSIVEIGYLASAIQLGTALSSIPSGLLVDAFSVKRMLLVGGVLMGITSICLFLLNLYFFILASFFLIGIFYANISPAMSKGIVELFPPNRRGTVMGIKQTSISVSAFIVALWLPYIATHHDWKTGYVIMGAMIILFSITALFYKDSSNYKVNPSRHSLSLHQFINLLQNDSIRTICLVAPFLFIAQFTTAAYLMVDVNERFDIPLIQAGYLLAFLQLGSIAGRLFFGMVGDWLFLQKRQLLLSLIAGLTGLLFILFALIQFKSYLFLSILVFLIGFTSSGWNGIFTVIVSESMEVSFIGIASGFTLTLGYLGSTVGTPFFGYLSQLFGGFEFPWMILAGGMFFTSIMLYRLQVRLNQRETNAYKHL